MGSPKLTFISIIFFCKSSYLFQDNASNNYIHFSFVLNQGKHLGFTESLQLLCWLAFFFFLSHFLYFFLQNRNRKTNLKNKVSFFFFFFVFQRVQRMWSAREDSIGLCCLSYEECRLAMVIVNSSNHWRNLERRLCLESKLQMNDWPSSKYSQTLSYSLGSRFHS